MLGAAVEERLILTVADHPADVEAGVLEVDVTQL